MNTLQAYADLRALGQPILRTREVAARLRVPDSTAHAALTRLQRAGLVTRLRQGLWSLVPRPNPLTLPEHLTAPYPSYVSFESALFRHGMIEQIPPRVTVASLGRAQVIKTAVGTYVVRHLPPRLFGGHDDRDGARLAVPEKALFDTVYHTAQRGWKAAHFPEIELPDGFDLAALEGWVERIASARLRTMVRAILRHLDVPVSEHGPSAWKGDLPRRAGQRTPSRAPTRS